MKKVISIILILTIILATITFSSTSVLAATSGTTGYCTWSLDGTVLTISGNGKMGDYDYSSYYNTAPWGKTITEVIIEDSVTSIGADSFYNCTSLTSVTIPDSVTNIGESAFYNCSKLASITIPDSVTSIGAYAFTDCDSLTNVNITDIAAWCNIRFEYFGSNPFVCAENLYLNGKLVTDLIIPDGVNEIKDFAFCGCNSLTSITLPDSVTSIGDSAFSSSLTSITIPNSVTSIEKYAFYYCSSLEEITLPFVGNTLNGVNNTHFGYIFGASDYKSNKTMIPSTLKKVTITGSSSIDENAFYECINIEEIILPDNMRRIYDNAFYSCRNLKNTTIPQSVTNISSTAFDKCDMLTINCIKGSNAENFAKDYGIPYAYITSSGKINGDVNGDGNVDTTDLAVLKQHLAGIN